MNILGFIVLAMFRMLCDNGVTKENTMRLIRNILMLPLIIILRMIPGLLWHTLRPVMGWLESWHDVMDDMGIFWKREGDE